MERVKIFDTTLRDGEQSPGCTLNLEEKVEIAHALEALGVDVIEAGFPSTSPGDFEAVRRIAQECRGCSVTALTHGNRASIDRTWEAVKVGAQPRIHIVVSTSDIHLTHQLNKNREEALALSRDSVKWASQYTSDVEFSPMDATRSDPQYLFDVLTAVIDAGATTVNIADTVGYSQAEEFYALIRSVFENVPNIHKATVSCHCHNDLGQAVANSLAGVRAGVRQVECTINGLGERAGNASLEEIVMALRTRQDYYQVETGIRTQLLAPTSRLVSELTGMVVQPNKAIVGANAFRHESGLHQDGIIKKPITYEIMRPEDVGVGARELVLGKHSGRHGFRWRLQELGITLSPEDFQAAFERFKRVTDEKKVVTDDDLHAIVVGFMTTATVAE